MSRENTLVTADWVEDHLDDPNVVLVEVDEDTTAYDKGHIRGAIKLDWTTDLQDQVRRDFVNKAQFEELLSERGVANDDTVVLYGGNNNWFAAYAYWYFKLYGHQDVKLLDGGRKKWELDSRELTDEPPSRETTSYTAQEQDRSIRAFRDEVVEAIGAQNLVDVRSPDEYAGRLLAPAHLPQEQAQRAGHIPTAANVPWSKAANDDGTFKSDDELQASSTPRPASTVQGHHRLLPHRRALLAHLVRAPGAARPGERQELRRLLDRVRLAGRRPGRARRRAAGDGLMCGATGGRPLARRRRRRQGGDRPGPGPPRRRAGRQRLRAAARPHRRVHRRGADVGDRPLPVLRRRRASGRCARWPRRPRWSTRVVAPSAPSPR